MGLPWIRLDTSLPTNPKVLRLVEEPDGRAAAFVYVCGLAYCGEHGTDGFIPRAALRHINGELQDAKMLASVGLWQVDKAGWFMPDWSEFQQTTEQTEALSASRRSSAKKGNCIRWHGVDCGCWRTAP